jgi:hypothetical protein
MLKIINFIDSLRNSEAQHILVATETDFTDEKHQQDS